MPHLTEEIWQTLTQARDKVLALQNYPELIVNFINPELERDFDLLIGVIRTIRNLRAEAGIKPGVEITVILQTESETESHILHEGATYIRDLAKVENLTVTKTLAEDPGRVIASVFATVQILIPLAGIVDIDLLRSKLEKNLAKVEAEVKSLSGRLSNPGFVNKAPAEVVQGARDALAEAQKAAEILSDRLQRLK
jgi:valyl-tRNA synthetase